MFSCPCGRSFVSENALDQHRRDKLRLGGASPGCQMSTNASPQTRAGRHTTDQSRRQTSSWMCDDVASREAICTIDHGTLVPSAATVSSTQAAELVGSYNWQNCKNVEYEIPGSAPVWQHGIVLPVQLPPDKGTLFQDEEVSRISEYPFEPLAEAAAAMNPGFNFDEVDVVVNRHSLRKLLDFCGGRTPETFRVNLLMVRETLFIERSEKNARSLIRGTQNVGWGKTFERTFTKYPAGLENSTAHHRSLLYPIGNLNCVVRFELDACYQNVSDEAANLSCLDSPLGNLSLSDAAETNGTVDRPAKNPHELGVMDQSTQAEIKTSSNRKNPNISKYLPQLWLGRTPWLIVGSHTDGNFGEISIIDAGARFTSWETRRQVELRKLVAVLARLRDAVRGNGGGNCVAIYEHGSTPRAIKVFASTMSRRALPDVWIRKLWAAEDGGTASSEMGGASSTQSASCVERGGWL
ncbi:Uncharacterized protein TCAP_07130 [Tolypocladium capitatum]|uniref:Uncharacterized protein n=1 Tax=Tolypocladium capitatum TaxID=45235 RepID=A0A2K3Q4I6_9HYPO|nr:Uncharacterized protein TCAP_07130 [Tolypocladium capitatum]